MIAKAKARHVYDGLEKVDVLKKLPCSDNSFDYLTCVGATTYLGKHDCYYVPSLHDYITKKCQKKVSTLLYDTKSSYNSIGVFVISKRK